MGEIQETGTPEMNKAFFTAKYTILVIWSDLEDSMTAKLHFLTPDQFRYIRNQQELSANSQFADIQFV